MKSNQTRRLMVSVGVVIALGVALAWEYVHRQETSGRGGGVASLSPGMSTDNSPSAATGSAASAQYSPAPPAAEPEHAIAALPSEHAAAAPPVPSCADLAQGQIAWDYEGNKDWNSDNVQNLCRGTSNPTEPPRCFDRVMHGGINWGGGMFRLSWKWRKRSSVKMAERTYEEGTKALRHRREGSHSEAASFGQNAGLGAM